MKSLARLAAGLALFAGGFFAACGGNGGAEAPESSTDKGTPVTIVLSGTLTLITEEER